MVDSLSLTPLERMGNTLKKAHQRLELQSDEYKNDVRLAQQMYEALKHGRFTFDSEPWYCTRDVVKWLKEGTPIVRLPQELLLRATTHDGQPIPPGPAVAAFVGLGLARDLDLFLVPEMISYGKQQRKFPISINVSSSAATTPEFWQGCFKHLKKHLQAGGNKADIVFEIEREALESPNGLKAVKAVREQGFRFAIDDFYSDELHPSQIETIARYIDFIKFTGAAIQGGIEGKYNLGILVEQARAIGPEKLFVAKWVDNHEQALKLFKEYNIDAAQGRNLPDDLKDFAGSIKKYFSAS